MEYHLPLLAMSEEQLAALIAKLKEDAGLQEKLKGAADLDAVLAIAKDAGFTITVADLLRNQAQSILELSDAELESVSGGYVDHSIRIGCKGQGDYTAYALLTKLNVPGGYGC